jgi:hypothetical protein
VPQNQNEGPITCIDCTWLIKGDDRVVKSCQRHAAVEDLIEAIRNSVVIKWNDDEWACWCGNCIPPRRGPDNEPLDEGISKNAMCVRFRAALAKAGE